LEDLFAAVVEVVGDELGKWEWRGRKHYWRYGSFAVVGVRRGHFADSL
jgi:hypothetical protein